MTRIFSTPRAAALAGLAAAALLLSACHHTPTADGATGSAAAAPTPALSVLHGRLVLPAVPGHPAAAYFTLQNAGGGDVTVTGVSLAGASSAELHETTGTSMAALPSLEVPAHGSVSLAPGGKHVMVFGLAPAPAPGGTVALSLKLKDGESVSANLDVAAAGSAQPAADPMAGMKM